MTTCLGKSCLFRLEIAVYLAVAGDVFGRDFCAVLFPTRCLR